MKLARRLDQSVAARSKTLRRLAVKDQFRRGLSAERLEDRSLMAADVINGFLASGRSDYWNARQPTDVNSDTRVTASDALAVINQLNAYGPRQLGSAPEGETSRQYVDVNNDQAVTAWDALMVINRLNAEGAPPDSDDLVNYILTAVPVGGDPSAPLTTVRDGQQFELVVQAQDLRPAGTFIFPGPDGPEERARLRYVFNAWVDIAYEDSLTPVAVKEIQNLAFTANATGSTTLTLNDPGTGTNIVTDSFNFDMTTTAGRAGTATAVANALNAKLGAGTVTASVSGTSNIRVEFGGKFVAEDVAPLTASSPSITVTEFRKGDPSVPASFRSAVTHSPSYQTDPGSSPGTDLLNDIGGTSSLPFATTILEPIEVFRIRMIADLPDGQTTAQQQFTPIFQALYANMSLGHETSLIGNVTTGEEDESGFVDPLQEIAFNTVTLNIVSGPINANADAATILEDTAASSPSTLIPVLANDQLNAGGSGTIELRSVTQPASGGTVTVVGNQVRFVPAADFAGTATFTYTAGLAGSSNAQDTATATVTVTVTAVNDAPTLGAIAPQNINEETATTVNLTGIGPGGGADESGQGLTVTATSSNPSLIANPTVTYTSPGATGTLNFTPAQDQSGTATITVTVTDDGGTAGGGVNVTTRTFAVNVAPVNDPPVNRLGGAAFNSTTVIAPGATFDFSGASQLSVADLDAGAANITTRLSLGGATEGTLDVGSAAGVTVTGDNSGTVTLTGPQAGINQALSSVIYTPGTAFSATLTMATTDNANATTTSTITISRDPGIRPFAVNDAASIDEGRLTTEPLEILVLGNDFIEEPRSATTITAVTQPSVGSVTTNGTTVTYTPPGGDVFTPPGSPITFTYTIDDGAGGGAPSTATVAITINNTPDAPVGVADTFDAQVGQPNTIALPGVLVNDTDIDGDTLTAVNAQIAAGQGTVTLNSNGSFVYTPPATTGTFTFTYQARDPGGLTSAPTTVTMRVSGPASAVNDAVTATEDGGPQNFPSVLANDDDGDPIQTIPLTATLVSNVPAGAGAVTLNSDGTYTYNPAANFSGTTSFTYRANAGAKVSNVATVSITVTEVNDPPTAVNDTFMAVKRSGTAPNEIGVDQPVSVTGNDSVAPDTGETFTVTGIGLTANGPFTTGPTVTSGGGSVRISGGQILYTSPTNAPTTDTFFYEITDSRGGTASAQVNVNVVDFVPKVISGTVYVDSDNDGVIDFNERRLAGVDVTLTGTDFTDAAVNVTVTTDINGNYSFGGAGSNVTIKPPKAGTSYTLTETNPAYLLNGLDTSLSTDTYDHDGNSATAEIPVVSNTNRLDSQFRLTWNVTDSGNVTGLNFGERGVDVSSLSDSSGFMQEYLASSGSNGFVMAVGLGGDALWNWTLPGWENAQTISATLSSDLTTLTITGTDKRNNPFSVTLRQNPSIPGSMARFRILGVGHDGQYIIRVDGTAAEAGLNLLAAAPAGSGGEGEGSAADYAAGADALFAGQAWA